MGSDRNIFIIARKGSERDEDQLTELLAWLLEEVPAAKGVVADLAGAAPVSDWEVETQRAVVSGAESGRLDLLLVSTRSTVIIEVKVDAAFSPGQLRKYTDWLRDTATTADRRLMTLTEQAYQWPPEDISHAESSGVRASAFTWSTLRRELSTLNDDDSLPVGGRALVDQFCAMLAVDIGRLDALRRAHFDRTDPTAVGITNDYYMFFGEARHRVAQATGVKLHRNSEFWRRNAGFPMWYGYGESAPAFAVGFDSVGGEPGLIVGVRKAAAAGIASPSPAPPTGWLAHSLEGGSGYRWFSRSLAGVLRGDESLDVQQGVVCGEWIRALRELAPSGLPEADPTGLQPNHAASGDVTPR